jgi:hypothetical protein
MRLRDMFQSVVVRPLRRVADTLMGTTSPAPAPAQKPVYTEPPVPKAEIPVMRMSASIEGTIAPWQTRTTPPLGSKPHIDPVVAKAVKDPSDAEIERAVLAPVDEKTKLAGITQKMIVEDKNTGRRYVFKQPEEKTQALERELLAMSLRRAAGQPSVAVAAQSVTLSDGKKVDGYVKPFVESQGPLSNDPRQWTEKQKTAVLVDHLWAELTGNYDTKPLQYVVCGEGALNIDWDHAGKDLEKNPWASWGVLDRHKGGAIVPAAQRLLLSSYVRGEVTLDTAPLYAALREIEKLTRADFEAAVQPLFDATLAQGKKLGPFESKEQLVAHMQHRQQTLRPRFDEMLRRTNNERAEWSARSAGKRTPTEQRMLFSFGEAKLTVLTMAMSTPIFDVAYQVSQKWQALRSRHD